MLCCSDCTVETETTLTAVIFLDHSAQIRANKLQEYAQKHMKKMHAKRYRQQPIQQSQKNQQSSYQHKEDKENLPIDNYQLICVKESDLVKTKRKTHIPTTKSLICEDEGQLGQDTGRFRGPAESRKSIVDSHCRHNMDSKTTSFGSLASRHSNSQLIREREVVILRGQLDRLRQEEMELLRGKLEKEYLYRRELLKIVKMKDDLKAKGRERQAELGELRQLFAKNRAIQ